MSAVPQLSVADRVNVSLTAVAVVVATAPLTVAGTTDPPPVSVAEADRAEDRLADTSPPPVTMEETNRSAGSGTRRGGRRTTLLEAGSGGTGPASRDYDNSM